MLCTRQGSFGPKKRYRCDGVLDELTDADGAHPRTPSGSMKMHGIQNNAAPTTSRSHTLCSRSLTAQEFRVETVEIIFRYQQTLHFMLVVVERWKQLQ